MRWNRVAKDLRLSDEQLRQNLIFTGAKVHDYIKKPDAEKRRDRMVRPGAARPHPHHRAKGPDYVYRFLKGFYRDDSPSRPTGVNNLIYDGASMPAVLADLQGVQRLESHAELGAKARRGQALRQDRARSPGTHERGGVRRVRARHGELPDLHRRARQGPAAVNGSRRDPVPSRFHGFAYSLKKEYWKDVH